MTIYISILFLTIIIASIGNYNAQEKTVRFGSLLQERKFVSNFTVFLTCAVFVFFFAARWRVGTDFGAYFSVFHELLGVNIKNLIGGSGWGFYTFTAFIGKYIFTDFFLYSVILGALIYTPVVCTFRKYSSNFTMTCALYIMMCLYTWPYNGVRQSVSVAILFFAIPLLYERKNWWKFAVLAMVAYTFHSTALLVIPFILLCMLKPWKKPFTMSCIIIFAVIVALPSLWTTIIDFLENIGQSKMAEDYADFSQMRAGVNVLRIIVAAIPVVLSFIYYPKLKRNNNHIDFLINMCVMNLIFLLFGNRLTVLARFSSYFNVALPILVPEFSNIFKKNVQPLIKFMIYAVYLLHMIILLQIDSQLIPYNFIFDYI